LPGERDIYSEVAFHSSSHLKDAYKTSVVSGKYKLILDEPTDSWELYDLFKDPGENENLYSESSEQFKEMSKKILDYKASLSSQEFAEDSEVEIEDDEVKQLESLGYM